MTFLNPAVLFGLIAASIPVIIHLLNLRKLKKIEFSTLTFLKELQKNKIRRIKIKQWLLLLLRVVIIISIVLAFSRPTLEGVSIGGTTSAAKTTAVFILDDTFSMSVIDSKGSYFNQAKQKIKNILSLMQEGDEVVLITVSSLNDDENLTTNFSEFEKRFEIIEVSDVTGTIHNAFLKASELISSSENFNKEIYLLSDFQKGRLYEEKPESNLNELIGENTKLYTISFGDKEILNVGIDSLLINTQIFEINKPVSLSAIITNYSESPVNDEVVSIYLSGERVSQSSVSLNPGESRIINFEITPTKTGFNEVFAEIEEDDIKNDNKSFSTFYIPGKIKVAVFSSDNNSSQFVELALEAGSINNTIELIKRNTSQFASSNLNDFSSIIFIGSKGLTSFDKINSFLKKGKGVLIFPGENESAASFNNLLNGLNVPGVQSVAGNKNEKQVVARFENTDLLHPVFSNIFSDKDKKEFESPDIYYYLKTNSGKGINIITLSGGSPFMQDVNLTNEKMIVFYSSPVLSWSNFPLKNIFAPLITKSVSYISSSEKAHLPVTAGEQAVLDVEERTLQQVTIKRPDGTEDILNIENNSDDILVYSKTNLSGIYNISSGENLLQLLPVNVSNRESVTEKLEEKEFDEYLEEINFAGNVIEIFPDDELDKKILQARFGSETWRYFLLAAIILALIEMTIARNAKKETEGLEKQV